MAQFIGFPPEANQVSGVRELDVIDPETLYETP
jgi:hypothetical protein